MPEQSLASATSIIRQKAVGNAEFITILNPTRPEKGFWPIRDFAVASQLHPKPEVKSAVASGRRAAAWIFALGTVGLVPAFFLRFDGYGPSIAIWLTLVPFLTMVAFLIGWIIGIFRYQKDKSQKPGDSTVKRINTKTVRIKENNKCSILPDMVLGLDIITTVNSPKLSTETTKIVEAASKCQLGESLQGFPGRRGKKRPISSNETNPTTQ